MIRRAKYRDDEVVRENRKGLIMAFADLRKEGLIAKPNYLCCQNCAGSAIADNVSKMSAKKAGKVKGCVYWHRQDEEDIGESGSLHLAYGNLSTTGHGKVGLATEEVGKMVVETLKKFGLKVEWDGDGGTRIWVDLTKPKNGGPEPISKPPKKVLRKVLKVTGKWDGNAFAVMGETKKALKDAGVAQEKISQVIDECTKGDYNHLIATCVGALTEAGYEVR